MKKVLCTVLCACLLLMPVVSYAQEEAETETEEQLELAAAEYEGYRLAVLDYGFVEAWRSYEDDPGTPAVCIRFYFENDGEEPLYLLESFGIAAYQDGAELNYISLNSDNKEAKNITTAVMDGAGLYCMMAFETVSDADVIFQITEPTADADLLIEMELPYDLDKTLDTSSTGSSDRAAADEYEYNVTVCSDEYVDIVLKSVSSDGAYFSITNNSDQTLQIDCEYIQLDGVEYSYDGSEYGSPGVVIAPGGTRDYDYIGYTLEDKIIFEIENSECSEISGLFMICEETGNMIEYTVISGTAAE